MIKLKDVSFTYENGNDVNGLNNVNLSINKGEVVVLCGESGCGKTTLTRLINGLAPNYYDGELVGEVSIKGKSIKELKLNDISMLVGSVFQNPRSQFFNVDTTSEVAFGCENKGLPRDEIINRVEATVSSFKIASLMNRSIFNLSGGEKQKIACASVSICEPDIFVLDEPSSNLDIKATNDLKQLISLWKEKGKTVVIAEHRLYYLKEVADRIIYMKKGKIEKEFNLNEMNKLGNKGLADMGLRPLSLSSLEGTGKNHCNKECKVSINNFKFSYNNRLPVINIDELQLPKGSIIGIIGHNGAGKTTFARCLCGLEKKCKGTLNCIDAKLKTKDRLKNCYMVMQDVNHQLFAESVFDEVLLSMKDENQEQIEDILKSLDLTEKKDLHPMSLSGGEKQRVAIASALASERDFILFDEPTSGLDYRHMKEVSKSLNSLKARGKTLFIISHDIDLILNSCNYIVHMEKGKVAKHYPLDSVGEKRLISFFNN